MQQPLRPRLLLFLQTWMQKYTNYDKITLEPIIQLRPAGGHQPGAVLLLRSWLGDSHGRTRDGEHH